MINLACSRRQIAIAAAVVAAAIFTTLIVLPFFVYYHLSFVHPTRFDPHLTLFVTSPRLHWFDFILPFKINEVVNEFRSRYLTYAVMLLDLKLRIATYKYLVLPPAFSIVWPIFAIAAYFLFRVVALFTADRIAAALAVLVYVSSTGFLSGFTMHFMIGKPLFLAIYLAAVLVMLRASQRSSPGQLFIEMPMATKFGVAALIFAGLLVDEMGFFTPLLLILVFPQHFFRWPVRRGDFTAMAFTASVYGLPLIIFAAYILLLVPWVTEHFLGFRFLYLQTLLGFGDGSAGAKSLFEGPYGGVTGGSIMTNFMTLFGLSLVPWQVSPLIVEAPIHQVISGQQSNLSQIAIVVSAITCIALLAFRPRTPFSTNFRRMLAATFAYILFQSMLNGRHEPYITSYYYGAPFSIFFALVAGFSFATLARAADWTRYLSVGLTFALVAIQVDNFYPLNESWQYIHLERMTRPGYEPTVPMAPVGSATTAAELDAIWEAWRHGGMEAYIASHPVSPGAVFLVEELRWKDHLRDHKDAG